MGDDFSPRVFLGVFLCGGLGASLRFVVAALVESAWSGARVPQAGVWACNLGGCLLIGAISQALPAGPWRPIIVTGLLGGFTTYSAFALYSADLVSGGRYAAFAAHLLAHVIGGLACVWAGVALARVVVSDP
ncbi:MAG: CrcB family protein [Nannocystaceae bacterium]